MRDEQSYFCQRSMQSCNTKDTSTGHIKLVYRPQNTNDVSKCNIMRLDDEILFQLYENNSFTKEYTDTRAISPQFACRHYVNFSVLIKFSLKTSVFSS